MKNKKRLIARIGAVIAVVLLVGALAVPCFADSYNNIHQAFYKMLDPRAMNFALLQTTEYYAQFTDERFFTYKTLVTGEMDLNNNNSKNFTYYQTLWSSDSGTWQSVVPLESFIVCLYLDDEQYVMDNPEYNIIGIPGRLVLEMTKGNDYSVGSLTVRFYSSGNNTVSPDFGLYYDLAFSSVNITGVLNTIYVGTRALEPTSFYDASIAFVPTQLSENLSLAMAVDALFENPYSVATYTNFVYSPYDFRQGFHAGFDDSYQAGYDEGYDAGYDFGETNGHAGGYKEGYTIGFDKGKLSSDSYQDGYNAGLATIDDNEFGRNFLINTFNAPFKAMDEFIIASWEGPGGIQMRFSMGQLVGACVGIAIFSWFLKLFLGG